MSAVEPLFSGEHPDAIQSSLQAASYAGIPLTSHALETGCAVIIGDLTGRQDHDWSGFARDELTVVVPRASGDAQVVAARLIFHGRRAQTPVAFVCMAHRGRERIEVLSLGDVSLSGCPLATQTVMIVGDVAGNARMPSGSTSTSSPNPAVPIEF